MVTKEVTDTKPKAQAKKGKGRPTPKKNNPAKALAEAEANRKAQMQWYAIAGLFALIVIGGIVVYSIWGGAEPYTQAPPSHLNRNG